MSHSHDQSYYEISLTSRHMLSIFVVLLVCVLVAFLGGVWLGRGADASVEMAASQAIVAAEDGDAPLERLDFFNRSERDAEPATPAPAVSEEPPGDSASEGVSTLPSRAAKQPAQPARASNGAAPSEIAPAPAPDRSEPANDAVAARSGSAAPVPNAVVVQVFSSNQEAQALRVVEQLRESGYPAILSPVEVAGRILHRVRIGPYTDPDEAEVVAESVRRAFQFETWITR